ncbi:amphi-Trp domain-containing protein [Halodesulfovibrio sp.]|jgi:amphi-Trp domain-containing protein|uniref:amphi-Trp domain-containing protein n=1 Tax=Halodesulfovibrio sp. TaxID=1912772 RepID=UPI0025F5017B|nr:amphi-Trp domain-containing protein [Halodesulfovibrio sp.]MCT4627371.1 amphi-Trp domain-containing protein [Halodesulfovibrio sp.]
MEKKKIHISGTMPCTLAVSHLDCFLDGLKSGAVVVEEGDKKIVLNPHSEVDLDIEARTKKDMQRLVITMEWCTSETCSRKHDKHRQKHSHGDDTHEHHHEELSGSYAHHEERPHQHDEHGFHSHHHCHGKDEHQLCHTHEHADGHHDLHQQTGCCEDIEHEPHKGCCSKHNFGSVYPYGHEAHEHGYKGCCEGIKHTPHEGCCAEHDYGNGHGKGKAKGGGKSGKKY